MVPPGVLLRVLRHRWRGIQLRRCDGRYVASGVSAVRRAVANTRRRAAIPMSQDLSITWRDVADLKPYPNNARKIPQSAIDAVAKSIRQFGWRQPIVVDKDDVIVIGHVRRLAALQERWTQVPV